MGKSIFLSWRIAASLFTGLLFAGTTVGQVISSTFQRPIDGTLTATRQVGEYEATYYCGNHLGVDIGVSANTPVRAISDGAVKYSGNVTGLGHAIHVEHTLPAGGKIVSVYYHLKRLGQGGITLGSTVTKGQIIGHTTNVSMDYGTGPHLHLGIRKQAYQSGIDPRTEKWFYPGYTAIFSSGVRVCNQSDTRHAAITSEWDPDPLNYIDARLGATLPAGYVSQGGLVWMKVAAIDYSWTAATTVCAGVINGQTGWRLPTIAELNSLYASNLMRGQGWELFWTWSSTPAAKIGVIETRSLLNLFDGRSNVSLIDGTNKDHLTCVR